MSIPYVLVFLIGAGLIAVLPRTLRPWLSVLVPAWGLYFWFFGDPAAQITATYAGLELIVQRWDGLSRPFVLVFTIMLLIGGLYSFHVKDAGERVAGLLYGGAAIGAVLAGDLLTLFIFWEVMAWTSLYLIWAARTPQSGPAGQRYLIVHLLGGSLLLAGLWLQFTNTGSLAFNAFGSPSPAAWLILLGFAINAAIPPLHAWLPDAYPAATITGSVMLSAFTTKTAVYVLARAFAGWEVVMWAGIIMAIYGVVFAVLENDTRRLLSYHIISQVGYMVAAVGLGTELAINGATAHAFAHVLYKSLLFMGAGGLIYATGRSKLTELGGLARALPLLLGLYMVGAVSISGFPLFSGFVSKAVVTTAFAAANLPWLALALQFASIGTFLSVGLKLPYFAWFNRSRQVGLPTGKQLRPLPTGMYAGMTAGALISFLIGIFPGIFYRVLPYGLDYAPYTAEHLAETSQLLLLTAGAFVLLLGKMYGTGTITLDTDWLYRRTGAWFRRITVNPTAAFFAGLDRGVDTALEQLVNYAENPVMAGRSPTIMTGTAAVLIGLLLLFACAILLG